MRKEEGGEQEAGSSGWGTQLRQRDQKVTISITGTKCRNCHTFEVTLVPTSLQKYTHLSLTGCRGEGSETKGG